MYPASGLPTRIHPPQLQAARFCSLDSRHRNSVLSAETSIYLTGPITLTSKSPRLCCRCAEGRAEITVTAPHCANRGRDDYRVSLLNTYSRSRCEDLVQTTTLSVMVSVLESMIIDRNQLPHRRRCGTTSLQNPSAQCFSGERACALKPHFNSQDWPTSTSVALRLPPATRPVLQ